MIDQETANAKSRIHDYTDDETRLNNEEEDEFCDQEHYINVLSDGFNQIIDVQNPIVGELLRKIKDGYESVINSVVENLSLQIDFLSQENQKLNQSNQKLEENNLKLQQRIGD